MKNNYSSVHVLYFALAVAFLLACTTAHSQSPRSFDVDWSLNYGLHSDQGFYKSIVTSDNNIVTCGFSYYLVLDSLQNGSLRHNPYLIKVTTDGEILWEQVYDPDIIKGYLVDVIETADGGYLASSYNIIYDLPNETIIFKTNESGEIQWQHTYNHRIKRIFPSADGGYFLAGNTEEAYNGFFLVDYVLIKIDSIGNIINLNRFGSDSYDYLRNCKQTADGQFIYIGTTYSVKTDFDYSVCKVNQEGNMQWFKTYGGDKADEAESIRLYNDGSFLIAGTSKSEDSLIKNYGGNDFWLVKTDSNGSILWQRNYGGSLDESLATIIPSFNGCSILTGATESEDYDVSQSHGWYDGWMMEIDSTGNLISEKSFGGSFMDYISDILPFDSSTYILSGRSLSSNGDLPGNFGGSDGWLMSVSRDIFVNSPNLLIPSDKQLTVFPNPANDFIRVNNQSSDLNSKEYRIYNINGGLELSGVIEGNYVNTQKLSPGIYCIVINGCSGRFISL